MLIPLLPVLFLLPTGLPFIFYFYDLFTTAVHRVEAVRRPPRKIADGRGPRLARVATSVKRVLVGIGLERADASRGGRTAGVEIPTVAGGILRRKNIELRRINRLGLAATSDVRGVHLGGTGIF